MNHTTPLEQHDHIYFKREDYNKTGSLKDRAIQAQIQEVVAQQASHLVISSSGNAGISAAYYAKENNLPLTVFISPKTNPSKRSILEKTNAEIMIKDEPLTESLAFAQKLGAFHLRQSTSEVAPKGYHQIATELINQLGLERVTHNMAIFFPVSSGTSLIGTYQGFLEARKNGIDFKMPQFHAVQSQFIQPIAEEFDDDFKRKSSSIVDAIVPPLLPPRKDQVVETIQNTNGSGWVVMDDQVMNAHEWLLDNGLTTSFEGALALAGYWKAMEHNFTINVPVIMLTGTFYKND